MRGWREDWSTVAAARWCVGHREGVGRGVVDEGVFMYGAVHAPQ